MSGVDAIPFLLKTRPPLKIVVLTVFENPSLITRALGYGAKGYLLKGIAAELLHAELKVVMLGGSALTAAVAAQLMEKFETPAEAPAEPVKKAKKPAVKPADAAPSEDHNNE